ncbi:MAG: SUMF1/EgtB/PvdO family nonheme iron enzyme [Bacteroidaceae bacterium]|nr:SUMF1/EgtB/PvdO family nonheme iron enzyme [Bacteroidaceae bacterium]
MRLKISNIKIGSKSFSFNIKWQEAWNNELNNDGVYVFAKYRKNGIWHHVQLMESSPNNFDPAKNLTPASCNAGSDTQLQMWIPEERMGAFLYPGKNIERDMNSNNVTLSWLNPNADDLKVMALEMTYISQGEFELGDPAGTNGPKNCLYTYPDKGTYKITSEKAISFDKKEGYLYCDQDNNRSRDEVPFIIPDNFPKGYNAFWLMKYGLSEREYVSFLNLLTRKQQQQHVRSNIMTTDISNYYVMTDSDIEKYRQAIVIDRRNVPDIDKPLTFFTYAPARACNAIAWKDVAAFACWAGLRPITDFEYEKACRGPLPAVPFECAWGSSIIGRVDTFSGADGSGYEIKVPTTGLVNANVASGIAPFEAAKGVTVPPNSGFEGPVTCGLFSMTRHTGILKRLNDGAGYYGNMELSGNLWDPVVTFGNAKGRAYTLKHGTGELDMDGLAQVPTWPGVSGEGCGVRGGVYRSPDETYLCVALRFAGAHTKAEPRFNGGLRIAF